MSFTRSRSTPITRAPTPAATKARRPSPVPTSSTRSPRKSSWRNWSSSIGRRPSKSFAASRHGSLRLTTTTSATESSCPNRARDTKMPRRGGRKPHAYGPRPDGGAETAMDVKDHGLYIAGKWLTPGSEAQVEVLDPATNRPIARVASATKEDVDAAVHAARTAFESPDWRDLDPSKRGRLLWLLGQQVRDHFDELSRLESMNVGKPIREAKGDIAYVYKLFEYYGGLADKIQGDTIPVPGPRFDYTLREPLGVTAHIAPWNYPLLLASRGIAPALAAGHTVVLKPPHPPPPPP